MQTSKLLWGSMALCAVGNLLIMWAGYEVDKEGWGTLIFSCNTVAMSIVLVTKTPWRRVWGGVGGMRRLNFAASTELKSIKEKYADYKRKGVA